MLEDNAPTMQDIDESYPEEMDEFPCPVCFETYSRWSSLHSHMSAHPEEEREEAFREWGAERLKEATIAIWEEKLVDDEKGQSKTNPQGADQIADDLDFKVGQRYNRKELHDVYGGQRYRGIATPKDYPAVFLFTGESGEEYGYQDEFKPDGRFLYTGEGTEGDMTWDEGNAAIRDHQQNDEDLHVFESTDEAWVVTYIGQYEYVGYQTRTMEDENDNPRKAFRFELEPVGGEEIETEDPDQLDMGELYERAKQSSPTERTSGGGSSGDGSSYSRSEVVRRYALREADGVCQGCGEDAPFVGKDGEPFLEVHHLHRRSDGGADDPDNVVALCPNCHRRRHNGKDGDEFNQRLIEEKEAS